MKKPKKISLEKELVKSALNFDLLKLEIAKQDYKRISEFTHPNNLGRIF